MAASRFGPPLLRVLKFLILVVSSTFGSMIPAQQHSSGVSAPDVDVVSCLLQAGINHTQIISQNHPEYVTLNYQWNKYGEDVQPIGFFKPESVAEIQNAVACGRNTRVRVVPKCGGHSFTKYSFGDADSLILDLGHLDSVTIDRDAGTCEVGGGARIGFVAWTLWTQARKVLPLGSHPGVGISSALGGGDGALARLHGTTLDNILELDMINANGQLLTTNNDQNSDLFWALRGAGAGSLGLVTRFKFKIHDPPAVIFYGLRWYDLDEFPQVFFQWQSIFMGSPPNTLNSGLHINESKLFLRLFEFSSDPDAQMKDSQVHRIFASLPRTEASSIQTLSYAEFLLKSTLYGFTEIPETYEPLPAFRSTYYKVKSFYVNHTLENVTDARKLYAELQRIPRHNVLVDLFAAGGRVNEIGVDDSSYIHRGHIGYSVQIVYDGATPEEPLEMEQGFKWMQNFYDLTQNVLKHTESYQNYVDEDLEDYLERYYGPTLERLVSVKKKYDPDNYFWTPQSIPTVLHNGSQTLKPGHLAVMLATSVLSGHSRFSIK